MQHWCPPPVNYLQTNKTYKHKTKNKSKSYTYENIPNCITKFFVMNANYLDSQLSPNFNFKFEYNVLLILSVLVIALNHMINLC